MQPTLRVLLLSSAFATTLTGCATLTHLNAPTKPEYDPRLTFCQVFTPILWNKRDTDETLRQVKAHNDVWVTTCGPISRPPPKSLPP